MSVSVPLLHPLPSCFPSSLPLRYLSNPHAASRSPPPPEPYTHSSSATSTGGYTYTNTYTTVPVPLGALNADVMDTAFTKAVVPIGAEHRFGDSTELGVAWGYK